MPRRIIQVVTFALLSVAFSTSASAQGRPIVVGVDGGFFYSVFDDIEGFIKINDSWTVELLSPLLRVDLFVTDNISIEPVLGLSITDPGGPADKETDLLAAADLLYWFKNEADAMRIYLAGGGLFVLRIEDETYTQFGAEGAIGAELPIGRPLTVRLEALVTRFFESQPLLGRTVIGATIGVSLWIH